ncbi:hypothetical protein C9374_004247 [Naegleria lovaniensis]|uniref:Uncharacterized protein n=1 Tax=Naegleria lovaniensis TaxID=51637 RepID=A0AA88GQP8_NAELO|nr:uncharacterized protein C9374_004247 [Naegleria lovaniensis]KAG2383576.1 hypothetical protein C9374_004247 [Naegleria lovaniensis]
MSLLLQHRYHHQALPTTSLTSGWITKLFSNIRSTRLIASDQPILQIIDHPQLYSDSVHYFVTVSDGIHSLPIIIQISGFSFNIKYKDCIKLLNGYIVSDLRQHQRRTIKVTAFQVISTNEQTIHGFPKPFSQNAPVEESTSWYHVKLDPPVKEAILSLEFSPSVKNLFCVSSLDQRTYFGRITQDEVQTDQKPFHVELMNYTHPDPVLNATMSVDNFVYSSCIHEGQSGSLFKIDFEQSQLISKTPSKSPIFKSKYSSEMNALVGCSWMEK